MCGCRAQRLEQPRMALVDLLQRQPAGARPSDRSGRGCPTPSTITSSLADAASPLLGLAAPRRLGDRVADRGVVLVARLDSRATLAAGDRALDELVQVVAVALLERRALGLPVVGEDDDLVRARREPAGALDPAELLVELAQRLERVRALEARVVGDLVVARERRVDGRAARASCR